MFEIVLFLIIGLVLSHQAPAPSVPPVEPKVVEVKVAQPMPVAPVVIVKAPAKKHLLRVRGRGDLPSLPATAKVQEIRPAGWFIQLDAGDVASVKAALAADGFKFTDEVMP